MNIIGRAGWGARPPRSRATVAWTARRQFIMHYSDGPPSQSVRSIQNFHMDGRGWADIGYNFLVDTKGRVYEGRGWLVVGAHAPGHNASGIGVCMIGRDGDDTPQARRAIRWLYDEACRRAGRTLARRGHRDVYATSCPGDRLYAWVLAGMPTEMEDDMPLTKDDIERIWQTDGIIPAADDSADNPEWKPSYHIYDIGRRLRRVEAMLAGIAQQSPDVDGAEIAALVLAGLTPEKIAAAIPPELAEQVVTALGARLAPGQ